MQWGLEGQNVDGKQSNISYFFTRRRKDCAFKTSTFTIVSKINVSNTKMSLKIILSYCARCFVAFSITVKMHNSNSFN
jgi:hypothetical protein